MTCYRLVFRSQDRETGSSYAEPVFRCQLPENLMRNGTNKKIKVMLEYFGVMGDNTDPHDACVLQMKNFAVNGSQTSGAGHFEGLNTLGVADWIHTHGTAYYLATKHTLETSYLEYNSFQFNQGKIEFKLERLDRTATANPGSGYYVIILAIKELDYE